MQDTIFREYDIRGKVGSELIIDKIYALGQSIVYYFLQQNPQIRSLALGMDGRTHSPLIKDAITQACMHAGIDVIFVGIVPSPVLYFAVHTLAVDGGLMITASHNSKEYNGIKLLLGTRVVWGKEIQEIKNIFHAKLSVTATSVGQECTHLIQDTYISWLCDHFSHLKSIDISCVIDAGNGACGVIIPELIRKLDWKHAHLLCMDVDGTYPNHEADPVVVKNMKDVADVLQKTNAVIGIGLDGDGDRMGVMEPNGTLIPGDILLALFANPILKKYNGATIIFDVKASDGLIELIHSWQGNPIMSPAGHAIIKEYMLNHQALLAGELSCHFFFKDRYFGYDDGIYALLRFIELLVSSGKTIQELRAVFPKRISSPEFRISCPEELKHAMIKNLIACFNSQKKEMITLDGVRIRYTDGWALIRASNTQAEVSIRMEANKIDAIIKIAQECIQILTPYVNVHTMEDWIQQVSG